jgi:phosphohistidine phosphatase
LRRLGTVDGLRRLTLIRHAKSSWKDAEIGDFDRPLNARGERDAPRMGRRIADAAKPPELLVSSPARRAARTAELIAGQLDGARLELERALYLATPEQMLDVIRGLDAAVRHAALVGHNPGTTELVEQLSGAEVGNVPTCGVVRLRLGIDAWNEVEPGCGEIEDFDYPKRGEEEA